MRSALVLSFATLVLLVGAAPASAGDTGLKTLTEWMTGSFSSSAQAEADSTFYDICLEMVRIWDEREDGVWMYIEQAVAGSEDSPYRQRVYHVTRLETDLFKSSVFELPDASACVGQWSSDVPLSDLSPSDLVLRKGCAVFLRRDASGEFAGGTVGRGCSSGLRGASFATSEVAVGPNVIESWDRGFDEAGSQVWGAESGPYVFTKRIEASN